MKVTYVEWDEDHGEPVGIKVIGGFFEATGPSPGMTIRLTDEEHARLSFSVVGATCDIDVERKEWAVVRDRIDSLLEDS